MRFRLSSSLIRRIGRRLPQQTNSHAAKRFGRQQSPRRPGNRWRHKFNCRPTSKADVQHLVCGSVAWRWKKIHFRKKCIHFFLDPKICEHLAEELMPSSALFSSAPGEPAVWISGVLSWDLMTRLSSCKQSMAKKNDHLLNKVSTKKHVFSPSLPMCDPSPKH